MEEYKLINIGEFTLRHKIAAFDYDWTLTKPKSNGTFNKNVDDWMWLRDTIPEKLIQLYNNDYCIIIFTNQTKIWKCDQIKLALEQLNIPVMIAIGLSEKYKKPRRSLWKMVVKNEWDENESFFVGDALGRPNDWSDSDLLFANHIGIKVKTPEEIFPFQTKQVTIECSKEKELVILVGLPGSGKTSIVNNHFKSYCVLSGDLLKTHKKILMSLQKNIKLDKSIIIDATNPTIAKRSEYIKIAQANNVKIRCIHVNTSFEESLQRNNTRDMPVPKIVYYMYRKNFQEPTLSEGFYEINTI
jgi:bifunctional polynucleotide phosphatase/kinase